MSMPPFAMWLRGAEEMRTWYLGFGSACEDSRMLPCEVNGMLSIAQYKADPAGGYQPWAIHALETEKRESRYTEPVNVGLFARLRKSLFGR